MFKVGQAMSYLKSSTEIVANNAAGDDAPEKEEKKAETEFLFAAYLPTTVAGIYKSLAQKIITPDQSYLMRHFLEVLTPPPSV